MDRNARGRQPRRGRGGRPATLALVLALLVGAPWIAAADEPPKGGAAAESEKDPLTPCDDARAKELVAELKKVARDKDPQVVLPVLAKIEGLRNEAFEKPLMSLLTHDSAKVATKVASMWAWRLRKKIASRLWRASWGARKNAKRFEVKALVLEGYARAGVAIRDRDLREVESDWRWIVGNPDPANGPALVAIARWVRLSKDKRLFRKLAEELDEPGTNVTANDPGNPSRDWWERRWKLWHQAKPEVVAALQALTGETFEKTAQAKAWLEKHGKEFGVKW
jgi:hypothetical protein